VDDDDRNVLQCRGLCRPARHRLLPPRLEVRAALLIESRVGWVDLRQSHRQRLGGGGDVARIELHVRIAKRMHVTHRAVDCRRDVEQPQRRRDFEIPGCTRLDSRVAGFLQQHGQPANLELGARGDYEVGRTCAGHQAGLGIDAVHVL
jgi:hypothetical protein